MLTLSNKTISEKEIKNELSILLLESMIEKLLINEHKILLENVLKDKTNTKKIIYEIYNKYYIVDNRVLLLDSKDNKSKEGVLIIYNIDGSILEESIDDDYDTFNSIDKRKPDKYIGYISEIGQKNIKKTELKIKNTDVKKNSQDNEKENYLDILRNLVDDQFFLDIDYRGYTDKDNFILILELLMRYKDKNSKDKRFFLRRIERLLNKN